MTWAAHAIEGREKMMVASAEPHCVTHAVVLVRATCRMIQMRLLNQLEPVAREPYLIRMALNAPRGRQQPPWRTLLTQLAEPVKDRLALRR